eukprot:scaffold91081_cov16-Tisochrysis_lutea.AAC.2
MLPIRCNTIRLEDFQMPRIVVVGGESTGKSSLLENITKCAVFPRDKDICTRMPIRMQLTNATDASDTAVEVQFGSLPATRLQDSSQVLGAVQLFKRRTDGKVKHIYNDELNSDVNCQAEEEDDGHRCYESS